MQLKIIFPNSHITIELKQHPTIEKWFKFFQNITNNQPDYYCMFFSEENVYIRDKSCVDYHHHWKLILESIQALRDINFIIPFGIPTEYNFNQKTLNTLHRFFTYNCEWWHNQTTESNPFDEKFVPPRDWDFAKWYSVIGQINEAVHSLELCTPTATKLLYKASRGHPLLPTWVINNPASITGELINTCYLPFDSYDQGLNYEPMDFSCGAPVTLNASILGKCMLQSYFEEDDPTAEDARGREGSYGGFSIHLDRRREEIYRSAHFQQWAEKYGRTVDSLPLEFQIGHVVDISMPDLFKFDPQQYIRTEFID
jgi:hypothetical protein